MDENQQAENEQARQQELHSLRKLQAAYLAVFGPLDKPTPMGELILDDLERFCGNRLESLVVSPTQGMVDIHATIYRTGKQSVMKRISERILWRDPDGE